MHDENCCSGVFGRTRACFFSCSRPVIPLLFAAAFPAKGHSDQSVSEKSGRKHPVSGEFAVPALSAPAENRGFPRPLRPVCCKSAAFAAKRPSPGRPPTIGTGARFSLAANPLQMQPDAHRIAARSRGRIPTTACDAAGRLSRCRVISSAVGIRRPPRCIG